MKVIIEEDEESQEERKGTENEGDAHDNGNERTIPQSSSNSNIIADSVTEIHDEAEAEAPKNKDSVESNQRSFHVDAAHTMTTGVVEAIRAADPPSSNVGMSSAAHAKSDMKASLRTTARQSGVGAFHVMPSEPEWEEETKEQNEEETGINDHRIDVGTISTTRESGDDDLIHVVATAIPDQDIEGDDGATSMGDRSKSLIHATPVIKDKNKKKKIGIAVLLLLSVIIAAFVTTARNSPRASLDNAFTSSPTPSPTINSDELQSYLEEFSSVEDLEQIGSPQRNALLWLANRDRTNIEYTDVLLYQRYAVVVLYYATQPNILSFLDIWVDETKHECDWGAVISCITDTTGMRRLTDIDLSKKRLQGTLPTEIGLLKDLEDLRISENEVGGTIPQEIVKLTRLTSLNLSKNNLSESIPGIIGSIKGLNHLILSENKLTGQLPDELYNLRALKTLDLTSNQLSGTLSSMITNLLFLTILKVRDNNFSGTVPDIFSFLTDLNIISLDYNDFHGDLPDVSISLARMEEITLSHNRFTGPLRLPDEFDGVTIVDLRLKKLDLSHNSFTGTLETALGYMPTLKYLDVSSNKISGTFPITISYMDQLEVFRASNNLLTGPLPQPPKNIKHIALKGNALTGDFFDSWFLNLRGLEVLSMGGSHPGPIPSEIGSLSLLQYFDASHCDLSGTLPLAIGNLPFLSQLRLEGNDLTGSLPSELGKLELMSELYLGDNALTSTIPAALKSMRSLRVLSLKNNKLSGSIPMEISELNDLVKLQLTGNILEGPVPREVCALGLDQLQVDSSVECSCC